MSLPKDMRERVRAECGVAALEEKVAALLAKADATEARLARAEAALAALEFASMASAQSVGKRITAVEASLGVFEAEGEIR